jgi:ubiquinone/menaquinone biosynthesis C-methylase UbiE
MGDTSVRLLGVPLVIAFVVGCATSASTTSVSTRSAPAPESVNPGINDRYKTAEGRARAVAIFEDPERGSFQAPEEIVKHLALKPGDVVADVGAGTGYIEPFLLPAIGSSGKVYAEDITPEFLERLKLKVAQNGWTNVETVVGTESDTKLWSACCNLVIVLDAYHHFERPGPMLETIRGNLRPGGRLVIIDFYRKPNDLFDKLKIDYAKHIRLDRDDVIKEIEGFGFQHLDTKQFLKLQYYAEFTPKP